MGIQCVCNAMSIMISTQQLICAVLESAATIQMSSGKITQIFLLVRSRIVIILWSTQPTLNASFVKSLGEPRDAGIALNMKKRILRKKCAREWQKKTYNTSCATWNLRWTTLRSFVKSAKKREILKTTPGNLGNVILTSATSELKSCRPMKLLMNHASLAQITLTPMKVVLSAKTIIAKMDLFWVRATGVAFNAQNTLNLVKHLTSYSMECIQLNVWLMNAWEIHRSLLMRKDNAKCAPITLMVGDIWTNLKKWELAHVMSLLAKLTKTRLK